MLSGLLIILVPLIVGYLIPLNNTTALKTINRLLSWIVYVILFFMGISLSLGVITIIRKNYRRASLWRWNPLSFVALWCWVSRLD